MTTETTVAAHRNTVKQLVGLDTLQAWIDSCPTTESHYTMLCIKTLMSRLNAKDVRFITDYSIEMERKANAGTHVSARSGDNVE